MIYIKRDPSLIPEKTLKVAERARAALEEMPPEERPAYIKRKSHIWRSFSKHLSKMSHGKCWYSESNDPQSFFDVDHFRPKLEAKRSEDVIDEDGYQWLAFDWENFRLSSQRSNRVSKDENSEEVVGKGSWFPLLQGSPKASWDDRCIDKERPVLLDPTSLADVRLLDVSEDGRVRPSFACVGSAKKRVQKSIELYGLNLPRLVEARKRVIRQINELYEVLMKMITSVSTEDVDCVDVKDAVADVLPVNDQIEVLRSMTRPDALFTKTARAVLSRMPGSEILLEQPEEVA